MMALIELMVLMALMPFPAFVGYSCVAEVIFISHLL
jgi:hypothetical protein